MSHLRLAHAAQMDHRLRILSLFRGRLDRAAGLRRRGRVARLPRRAEEPHAVGHLLQLRYAVAGHPAAREALPDRYRQQMALLFLFPPDHGLGARLVPGGGVVWVDEIEA